MLNKLTQEEIQSWTAAQLRAQLKKRKLGTNGKKNELVARLMESEKTMKKSKTKARQRKHDDAASSGDRDLNGSVSDKKQDEKQREMDKQERESIVLWRSPVRTIRYFFLEASVLLYLLGKRLYNRKKAVALCVLISLILLAVYHVEGAHQETVGSVEKTFLWCAYWVGLGILSSVGLGTGLHTFLLYLGPHIAAVTLAAYECMSTDFPEPPYPTHKVRLESFMWGAGTAIGELPPYFMARAARLSGADIDDDDFEELEELIHEKKDHPEEMSFLEKAKLSIHNLVQRVGFFGILLCASKLFVIFLFSEHHVETVVSLIGKLPKYGPVLQTPFKEYLRVQKEKLHHKPGSSSHKESGNVLAWIFEKVVIVMVAYFLLSIINSMAQNYHKRQCKTKRLLSR
ncbi:VMP1-like protein [Mya arenaria]|uniref:VMP1-like protein n=1 Tax=Mya arenaria TaxID=6604 RepID=A0ABY7E081_MYAAR|nr:VMP1-like protein [Mya arenaria]WAR03426.1 VMP1-like protein [Mya arenaria]